MDFDKELFIKNYQELKSSRKMGELYGCDKGTITAYARKIGFDYSNNKERKITSIPIKQIIEDYEKLGSSQKVAEKYKCSSTSVLNYLKKHNYNIQKNTIFMNCSDEYFKQKYKELKSAQKMGEFFNCSSTTILNHAHKIGYNPNENKEYKLSDEDKKFILDNYNICSSTDLAKRFNVSRGMITKLWHDANYIGKEIINSKTTEKDMLGKTFGCWTVISKTEKRNTSGIIFWHCRCICGTERDVIGNSLRNGTSLSCGCKNISKGNERIAKILSENNLSFIREYKFKDCIDKKELPFDFYVENQYLIEFDGIQHYQPNFNSDNSWNTTEKVEITKKHDEIKNNWCIQKNIPLIRIPYTHLNKITIEDLKPETSKFKIMPTLN